MSTDNLILTEHAIKRHAKRLQKQMKNYSQDLSLGESQNLLSKILGFNDWNHLNTILKPTIEKREELNDSQKKIPYKFIDSIEQPKIFKNISSDDTIKIFIRLINVEEKNLLINRAISLISAVIPALIYMRDQEELMLDTVAIREYLNLDNIIKIYKTRRDFPDYIRMTLRAYLYSLQDFNEFQELNSSQSKITIEQHEITQMQFFFILKYLEKIEKDNFIIADKKWFYRNEYRINSINSNFNSSFGKQQQSINNSYLILNNLFLDFDFIEDSWIDMPEYEEFILSLERKNKLNSIRVFDLVVEINKTMSPSKRKKMELLLNSVFENYSFASDISKQIQKNLSLSLMSISSQCEKDKNFLEETGIKIKPLIMIISSNELICKNIKLFINQNDIEGEYYNCNTFETIEKFLHHIKNNPKPPKFIICDENIELKNIYCPIIKLTEKSKEEIFYKTMSKLFFTKKNIEAINELKKYINENKGEVDFKYWKLLLKLYQESSDRKEFDKTVLIFSNKFDLEEKFSFDNFSFIPEEDYKNYFLPKPFSKEDLFKIIHYVESDI